MHNGGYSSWGCDGKQNRSTCPQGDIKNDTDVIYHDNVDSFDLCEVCAEKYRI